MKYLVEAVASIVKLHSSVTHSEFKELQFSCILLLLSSSATSLMMNDPFEAIKARISVL